METQEMQAQVKEELDSLLAVYKTAVEEWRAAIKEEEDFATPDHSMKEWETWDQAGFKEEEARDKGESGAPCICGRPARKTLQLLTQSFSLKPWHGIRPAAELQLVARDNGSDHV